MKMDSARLLVILVSFYGASAVRPRYQHFEDYLNNLDSKEQSLISGTNENDTNDEDTSSTSTTTTTTSTSTTVAPEVSEPSGKNKDVTCCALGQLAGDKGYHCYSQYYAARILMRNRNRAHNRKMAFYGPQRIRNYGEKLMRTFEQCVASRGVIFHKCCHLSSMERRVDRYDTVQRARHQQQQTHHDDDEDDDEESEESS